MSSSRFKADRSNIHASHEEALLERPDVQPSEPTYEVRERTEAEREHARGRAERVLSRWLDSVGAREVDLGHRGADIACLAQCDLGRISVVMTSPFRPGRDVRAVCDPCLVRLEIGERPTSPEAWCLSQATGASVAQYAVARDWVGGILTPGVSIGRLFPVEDGNTWIGADAIGPFLGRVGTLAEAGASDRKRQLFDESRKHADDELYKRRWTSIDSCKPRRWQRGHWDEVRAIAGAVEPFLPFDRFELRSGARCGWGASLLVGDKEREVKAASFAIDGQIRGRSDRWKVDLEGDIFRFDVPDGVDERNIVASRSWITLRLTLGASSEQGDHKLLVTLDDDSTHRFWIESSSLISEGLSTALGEVASQAAAIHQGPYR